MLCEACAGALAVGRGLLPGHISIERSGASVVTSWLVDGFGVPHPLTGSRIVIGRDDQHDVAIHHTSVSRDHAELRRDGDGWQVRDLGSKNGTYVDELRLAGRARLANRGTLRLGGVGFYLIESAPGLAADPSSIETSHAAHAIRYQIAGPGLELCLIASIATDEAGGGVLLHRASAAAAWNELGLPQLEHQLLQLLCEQAMADHASPSPTRGTVATRVLCKKLSFKTRFANEENVRQVVRRTRTSLGAIGAEELVGSVPGRGYYLTWAVSLG